MNIINNTFKIAEQHGQMGFYCEVTLDVSFLMREELKITCEPTEWNAAVEFGLHYAWEHIRARMEKGIAVRVVELETHPIDSSMTVVAFATAMCLMEAVGFTGESVPKFRKGDAKFHFSK